MAYVSMRFWWWYFFLLGCLTPVMTRIHFFWHRFASIFKLSRFSGRPEAIHFYHPPMSSDDEEVDDYRLVREHARKRRRLVVTAAIVGALCLTSSTRYTAPNRRHVSPFSWEDHVGSMSAIEFRKCYRITPHGFDVLLGKVRDDLSVIDLRQAQRSRGACVIT